jgi:hypothetical protein
MSWPVLRGMRQPARHRPLEGRLQARSRQNSSAMSILSTSQAWQWVCFHFVKATAKQNSFILSLHLVLRAQISVDNLI